MDTGNQLWQSNQNYETQPPVQSPTQPNWPQNMPPVSVGNNNLQPQPKPKHGARALVLIVAILLVAVAAILLVIFLKKNNFTRPQTMEEKIAELSTLDKSRAIEILENINNGTQYADDFFDAEIAKKIKDRGYMLLEFSHDSEKNLIAQIYDNKIEAVSFGNIRFGNSSFDNRKKGDLDGIKIEAVSPYFMLVSTNPKKIKCDTLCYFGVSFDRKYLDYHEEVKVYKDGSKSTNNVLTIKNYDPAFLRTATPILVSVSMMGGRPSVYAYRFINEAEKFTLEIYDVSVGINAEKATMALMMNQGSNTDDAILHCMNLNIYRRSFYVDKNTGENGYATEGEGDQKTKNIIIKSFELNYDEAKRLYYEPAKKYAEKMQNNF